MKASRRDFLKQASLVSLGFIGLNQYLSRTSLAKSIDYVVAKSWLELPQGFTASIISEWGQKMSDGFLVPGRPDGMATFNLNGKVAIIRNHENNPSPFGFSAFGKNNELLNKVSKSDLFDFGYGKTPGLGGTTTLIFNENTQKVEQQYLSLAGTYRNCDGGSTPWNSWISCEEDTTPQGKYSEVSHGYNFEVPVAHKGLVAPVPLKAMGRFNHEAVCVDPSSGIVFQTEDQHDGLIYRFIPNEKEKLHKGGTLQALAIKCHKQFDTRNWKSQDLKVNQELEVEWITLSRVDSQEDDLRKRGKMNGAAVFARGEGMWYGNNEVYFACTNGGKSQSGQVFKYVPSSKEGLEREKLDPGKLILFAEPNDSRILKSCDNLTVSPWGDVILVEDRKNAHIRGIRPDGQIYNIGRNIGSNSELAGICFSPSGKTMFVNVQEQGLTFAITGPWERLRKL
ncbi:DUF839 domain-containing protein [Marivirga sp. S37H4]|uniref:DUF839 domain-containing protein n=1 Tax=Marivirga aurantiaca TaxID=2802615 RepID=A0A934WXX4_9BACT|nr:alkaline phosphatase PhoX [Marivirga aurantiaca]MBK6264856.1 DUF839 domain-containing protein [Marivirga aurantiaca]